MRLSLRRCPDGAEAPAGDRILYELERGEAHAAPARVEGDALAWTLGDAEDPDALLDTEVELDPSTAWLLRCDRVDFPPGGEALLHTHPGPGIRCLLRGEITIETQGETHTHGPMEAWFERGPDPVYARTSATKESGFVRVMLVPAEYAGRRTISYVDPADAEKPKRQQATILLEVPVAS